MKAWYRILTGKTTSTPAEIAGEIDNLKAERAGVKAKLTDTQESHSSACMKLYGGSGDQAGVDALAGDVKALQIQMETLDKAIMDLKGKHAEAIEREKQAMIAEIDKKIAELRQWMRDIRPDYVRAKMTVEAYERLLMAPLQGVGMASNEALLITSKEREAYPIDVEAITQGHRSIMFEIRTLQEKREQIMKGGIDHE